MGIAGLALALVIAGRMFDWPEEFRRLLDVIHGLGPWGPALFITAYVLATLCFVPGSVLTLGAGALFGVVPGSIYVSAGATLGAAAAFWVGRHLARNAVARRLAGNDRFAAIDEAVAREGWKIIALTRLSPVFPFVLLNYAFGLTRVKFRHYVLASWIGMMPGTVMYVYLGSLAGAAAGGQTRTMLDWLFYGSGLLATLAVTGFVTRIAKRALAQKMKAEASRSAFPPAPLTGPQAGDP